MSEQRDIKWDFGRLYLLAYKIKYFLVMTNKKIYLVERERERKEKWNEMKKKSMESFLSAELVWIKYAWPYNWKLSHTQEPVHNAPF